MKQDFRKIAEDIFKRHSDGIRFCLHAENEKCVHTGHFRCVKNKAGFYADDYIRAFVDALQAAYIAGQERMREKASKSVFDEKKERYTGFDSMQCVGSKDNHDWCYDCINELLEQQAKAIRAIPCEPEK